MTNPQADAHWLLDVLEHVTAMSRVERKKVGALIVDDHNFVKGQGFNSGVESLNRNNKVENFQLHAEAIAIAWAARKGFNTLNATLFCTIPPCPICCNLIITAGITRVVYKESYWSENNLSLLTEAGIIVSKFEQ